MPEGNSFVTTDENASLTVYVQSGNNGRMEMVEYRGFDYTQFGGAAVYDEFRGQGETSIGGGKFICSSYVNSTELPVNIGWRTQNDSISIGQISEECSVSVTDGKSFYDGTSVLNGELTGADTAGKTLIPYDGLGALLVGHRVSLEGDIGVWFYMDLEQSLFESGNAVMRFTVPSGNDSFTVNIPVGEAKTEDVGGRTYYKFKCNVAVKDM